MRRMVVVMMVVYVVGCVSIHCIHLSVLVVIDHFGLMQRDTFSLFVVVLHHVVLRLPFYSTSGLNTFDEGTPQYV